jgi:hypothetical protein
VDAISKSTGSLLATVGVLVSLALSPSAAAAATEPAHAADSFVESIGVNTHTLFTGTPYATRFDAVKQRLIELGVHHVREDLALDDPDQYRSLNELASAGIRSNLIMGDPGNGEAGLDELVATVREQLPSAVDAVEGPNEYSTRGGPNWRSDLIAYQQRLYAAIKGDPALSSLPVIGPSIVHGDQAALGDVSSSLDYGTMHSYPNGAMPEENLSSQLAQAALNSGAKPVMATETGYNTAVGSSGELKPVSEEAMATYIPRLFLEYFGRGVARTYSYELLNEFPDPGSTEPESNFGLLRNDLSPKPAFTALRNTIWILSDPGTPFVPESLDYTLEGDLSDLHKVLLEKRDGSYYLALWRGSEVWDPASRTPVAAPEKAVKVSLGREAKSAEVYLPNVSATPTSSLSAKDGALTVAVGPRVTIVRIVPGAARAGRIKLWLSRHSVRRGGRVAVRGRLPRQLRGHSLRVKIQRRRRHGWQTVGHSHTSQAGVFRKKVRLAAAPPGHASRLRVVARRTKPSKPVRVRIRN